MSHRLPILTGHAAGSPPPPPAAPSAARERPDRLIDAHGRTIRDLRLSVTDRCNFRCIYCMEPDVQYMPREELLTLEERVRLVRLGRDLGIEKIRITGGEPTLYRGLDTLIESIHRLDLRDIALTTNGSLLTERAAKRWRALGLHRVTLSLDTLRAERMAQITRSRTTLDTTIRAIRAAQVADLGPVKVNAVIMRGINEDEVADFADFARAHDIDMRFIEWMPLDSGHAWRRDLVYPAAAMLEQIQARHELVRAADDAPDSTAMNYHFADGAPGRVGIIAPVTRPFCGACSRLRLTADGKLRPCLFSLQEWDLRPLLRGGADDAALRDFIIDSVWTKQAGHGIDASDFVQPDRPMSAIGG